MVSPIGPSIPLPHNAGTEAAVLSHGSHVLSAHVCLTLMEGSVWEKDPLCCAGGAVGTHRTWGCCCRSRRVWCRFSQETSAPPLGMGPGLCPSLYGCGWELTVLCCAVVAPDEQVFPTGFPSTPGNVIGVEEVEKLAPLWDFPTSEESHAAMGRPGMIPGVPKPGSRAGLWDAAPIPAGSSRDAQPFPSCTGAGCSPGPPQPPHPPGPCSCSSSSTSPSLVQRVGSEGLQIKSGAAQPTWVEGELMLS